jgi:hypothetical protein
MAVVRPIPGRNGHISHDHDKKDGAQGFSLSLTNDDINHDDSNFVKY